MAREQFRVLLVEDELDQAELTSAQLKRMNPSLFGDFDPIGVEVLVAQDQDTAEATVDTSLKEHRQIHLILLDLKYPWRQGEQEQDYSGMKWLPKITQQLPDATIVIFTAFPFDAELRNAVVAIRDFGAHDFIPKTTAWAIIEARLVNACRAARTQRVVRNLVQHSFEMLRSQAASALLADIDSAMRQGKMTFDGISITFQVSDARLGESWP